MDFPHGIEIPRDYPKIAIDYDLLFKSYQKIDLNAKSKQLTNCR
jgi:hypothetical protein